VSRSVKTELLRDFSSEAIDGLLRRVVMKS
jgi:hypothetical protein